MTQKDIENHLDWLEYKNLFKPTYNVREILLPIYTEIILESLENNNSHLEIESLFKSKVLSKFDS